MPPKEPCAAQRGETTPAGASTSKLWFQRGRGRYSDSGDGESYIQGRKQPSTIWDKLNPSSVTAHQLYGLALVFTGRFEKPSESSSEPWKLDPLSLPNNAALGLGFLCARQYDQAIEQERKTLDLDANFILAHRYLGLIYVQKSMYKEGIAEFEEMLMISPTDAVALSEVGYGHALAGRRAEAQKVLDKLNEMAKHKYVSAMYRVYIYAALGGTTRRSSGWKRVMRTALYLPLKRTLSISCARPRASKTCCGA